MGTTQTDATGQAVELGGSSVNTLGDSLLSMGLVPGSANLVGTTYTVFGQLVSAQYPELLPSVPPAESVIDTSYLSALAKAGSSGTAGSGPRVIPVTKPVYVKPKPGAKPRPTVSTSQLNIEFNAGKDTLTPQGHAQLVKLARSLLIAGGTTIEVHGHTDNAGDPSKSMPLSEARAFAVKNFLQRLSPVNFPSGRIQTYAHGETQPLVPNTTPGNRAKNRRVTIVLRAA